MLLQAVNFTGYRLIRRTLSAIYGMNHYTVDKVLGKQLLHVRYPLDRD